MATKGEQSRQRILEASKSIILESGIGKLSHGAIAEVLDISKSAIHWHFPTKDDLLKALIDDYLEHLQAEEKRHETPFIASGLSPEDAVLPAMRLWYLDFRENRAGWYKSLYDRIGRSSADTVRGYVAMMVFDGFFNSSKMGVMTLSDEEMDAMQMHVLREAYAARPDMLEVIEAVIGSGERM